MALSGWRWHCWYSRRLRSWFQYAPSRMTRNKCTMYYTDFVKHNSPIAWHTKRATEANVRMPLSPQRNDAASDRTSEWTNDRLYLLVFVNQFLALELEQNIRNKTKIIKIKMWTPRITKFRFWIIYFDKGFLFAVIWSMGLVTAVAWPSLHNKNVKSLPFLFRAFLFDCVFRLIIFHEKCL